MLVCALPSHIAHETAGAARTRLSLGPLCLKGERSPQAPDASRRGNAKACLDVIASEAKQSISLSEDRIGLLRRFAPRNDGPKTQLHTLTSSRTSEHSGRDPGPITTNVSVG